MRLEKRLFLILILTGFIAAVSLSPKVNFSLPKTWKLPSLNLNGQNSPNLAAPDKVKVVGEESIVIDVAEKVGPSVVTVSVKKTQIIGGSPFEVDPFLDPFGFFRDLPRSRPQTKNVERDIGSGFIISADGLVVTNKHVVSDTEAKYKIVTRDDKTYDVEKIYRDPGNDVAILKIKAAGLRSAEMGDSSKIKVGQLAIAIGTALGEFRHTVTTGVVSGLGRGISAGSPLEGAVERLDNVIQTDAAINPGNSGGPLLNSSGQVIGINTAISTEGQNIGFAIPINIVKEAIDNFDKTGQFSRPFLGVRYRMINERTALLNEVPQGALVDEVVAGSPAEKADIRVDDIITKIGSKKISGDDQTSLAKEIANHKVGESVAVEVWRDGKAQTLTVVLEEAK